MSYYRFFSKFYEMAAQRMAYDCQQFIKKGAKILDLGCGSAIVAHVFEEFFRAEVVGVDVLDRRIFPISFEKINGQSLPFLENNFDATLIFFVLHHSQNPLILLEEAKRVTKDKILIYEDLPEGIWSKLFCKFHGFSFDAIFGNKNKTSFKTEKEWRKVFEDLKLELIFQKKVSSIFNPVKKKLFVLRKA